MAAGVSIGHRNKNKAEEKQQRREKAIVIVLAFIAHGVCGEGTDGVTLERPEQTWLLANVAAPSRVELRDRQSNSSVPR